ncbi:MAG: hypothetical protein H2172_16370 [Opitutus sp.]|nr:hypothetical protein [Opitutus sp.]MCS6245408.1 hypothetical protein [Opitutus sp.]MCS6274669.1 hypothetical protein [Opitutus sp.]MCS6275902.1 hypothetical protein [Opitutus sp.]MCS6299789.1 hypothetical protein [Opitutus sp.]
MKTDTPTITYRISGILPGRDVILESIGGDEIGRYTHRLEYQPRPDPATALSYRAAIAAACHQYGAPIIGARHLSETN